MAESWTQDTHEVSPPGRGVRATANTPGPGTTLGRYLVIEEVGRGGMGVVLRAYDPKLEREVALKVLRADRLGSTARRRMIREARAMAMLAHPNVVEVYDVVDDDDRLMIAMQYIGGPTLAKWMRTEPGWRRVIEIFVRAGQGLVAAHAAGLLHRDFKPTNVLLDDDANWPRVTDFGLAHPASRAPGDSSVASPPSMSSMDEDLTHDGAVMGTVAYMAPEQHRGAPLSPAADQFAFCASVWQGLTGSPPYTGTLGRVTAQKLEGPPPWPGGGDVPRRIRAAVMRGLAPDPADRFPSMTALLRAIEPRKQGRRQLVYGAAFVGTGIVAAALVAGRGALPNERCAGADAQLQAVWGPERRTEVGNAILATDVPYAPGVVDTALPQLDAYAQDWTVAHTNTCEATQRGEQTATAMDLRMACLRRARTGLEATVHVLATADAKTVERAQRLIDGLPQLLRCEDVEGLEVEGPTPDPSERDAVEAIEQAIAQAMVARRAGRFAEAAEAIEGAQRIVTTLDYRPIEGKVLEELGSIHQARGEFEPATAALHKALSLGLQHGDDKVVRLACSGLMFIIGFRQGRPLEALAYARIVRGSALRAQDPRAMASYHSAYGFVLSSAGRYQTALTHSGQALHLLEGEFGADHPRVAAFRSNHANNLYELGRFDEARREYEAALAVGTKAYPANHPLIAMFRGNLASVYSDLGDYETAEAEQRAALEIRLEAYGPDHAAVSAMRSNLATTLALRGKHREAQKQHRAAIAAQTARFGPDHPGVALSRASLASVLHEMGELKEAEQEQRAALATQLAVQPGDHPDIAMGHNNLGTILQAQGRLDEAGVEYRTALSMQLRSLGPRHHDTGLFRNNLGLLLAAEGRVDEARDELRAALSIWEPVLGGEHPKVEKVRQELLELERGGPS